MGSNHKSSNEHKQPSKSEGDEEAQKWGAIMKLPTINRLKKGILPSPEAGVEEVNIETLDADARKRLLNRLIGQAEENNEKFLSDLRRRIEKVGISLPTIEVRFEHLVVDAEAKTASRTRPNFFNFYLSIVEGFLERFRVLPNKKKRLSILKDVSGIIKPARLTLLLGPPSSGKTTFLLALAGSLAADLKFSGEVTYNGHTMEEFVPQKTAAYISQNDLHIGQMTVRETLTFSARCQGVGSRQHMLEELLRREKEAGIKPDLDIDVFMKASATDGKEGNVIVDYVIKMLGLETCSDTVVGNEMMRGISGGQLKRLTTGEMMVGPARALFMDEISTGLDSSTTFQIVKYIRDSIHILSGTAVISLLQPSPETFELFDDIILLSDGYVVYQGPRENVLEFFENQGFECPERKGVADFLQEVTSKKDQQQYWSRDDSAYRFVTANEFSKAFKSFHAGKKLENELSNPYDKKTSHPAALETRKYGEVNTWQLLCICLAREVLLMKRNKFIYIFKLIQFMILGFVGMTIFIRTEMHKNNIENGGVFMGALFFSACATLFNGMVEISLAIARLPIFFKQRDFQFYPSWAYALPSWLIRIPLTVVEIAIWVFPTYYVIGYDPSVERFFRQFFILVLLSQMAHGLFRFLAVAARNMNVAITYGSFSLLILFCLGGFVLSKDKVKKWWLWAYWISPMMYTQTALNVNEFLGKSWSKVVPPSTVPLGIQVMKSRGFATEAYWYWIAVGALITFIVVFNVLFTVGLAFLQPSHAAASKESRDESAQKRRNNAFDVNGDGNVKRGMILPFEPHSIVFHNISYAIDMPAEMKSRGAPDDKLVILKGISGAFRPGVLTALMGVSGAGKTTLLDVLADRKTGGYIDGDVCVSGYPKNPQTFARISGYCEQFDIHSPHVTVYESLVFSAWLRLTGIDAQTRKLFVEEVMELVELDSLRNAMVGIPNVSGLSTGQRKRLTIAVELVANPSVIFMDEPTTGLDARAAAVVMRTVRNTVDTGRTVVCTIHQPSIDIFESFDELLLLKMGGLQIYSGPMGVRSSDMISYFQSIKGLRSIEDGCNPATWMLDVTSLIQEQALGIDFADVYNNSDLKRRTEALIDDLRKPRAALEFSTKYAQPGFTQFKACLWKNARSYWQNPSYTAVRLLYTLVLALTFGLLYWNLGMKRDRPQDLFNALGSMYSAVLFIGIQNAFLVLPYISGEKTVFYREKAAGMYSPIPYALAHVVIELPYGFLQTCVYGVIVYTMIGFEMTTAKFFWYLFFSYFTLLYFSYFGFMAIALTPSFPVATIFSSAFYPLWNLFSGFIVPLSRIELWWRWYYWACPVAWSMYGLLVSQFGDVKTRLVGVDATTEEFIRSYFGYKYSFIGVVAFMNVLFALLFALLYAFGIKNFNFQRR